MSTPYLLILPEYSSDLLSAPLKVQFSSRDEPNTRPQPPLTLQVSTPTLTPLGSAWAAVANASDAVAARPSTTKCLRIIFAVSLISKHRSRRTDSPGQSLRLDVP